MINFVISGGFLMKINYFIFLFTSLFMLNCYAKKTTIAVGQKAPNFSLRDATGKIYNLSDFQGKKIALYFFPKAGTPHCTKQACSLRNNFSTLKEKGIIVIGISNDSQKKQKNFSVKYNLPFLLLSDVKGVIIKAYGAKRRLFLNKRKTFLINEQGIIIATITKINVNNHAQQIIDGFA